MRIKGKCNSTYQPKVEGFLGEAEVYEAYSGVGIHGDPGEMLGVCVRDGGFEITYQEKVFRALGGELELIHDPNEPKTKSFAKSSGA